MEPRRYNLEANEANGTEISLLSQPNYSHTASGYIPPEKYNISSDVSPYIAENITQNLSNYQQPNLYDTQEISSHVANYFSQLLSTTTDTLSNLVETYAENTASPTISNTTGEVILSETSTKSSAYSNALQMLSELSPYSNYYGQATSNDTTVNLVKSQTSTLPSTSNTTFSIEQDLSPIWNDTLSTTSALSTTESTGFFHQISDKIEEAGTFIVNKTESLFNCSTMPCYETGLSTGIDGVLSNSTSSKQEQDEKSNQFLYVIITLCILVVVGILSGAFLVRKMRSKRKSFDVTMTNKAYL